MTPSGERGVLNDSISILLADATIASAFVVQCCFGSVTASAAEVGEDEQREVNAVILAARQPVAEIIKLFDY